MSNFVIKKIMYDIVGGPNRDVIFDAMKYAYDNLRIPIEFRIAKGYSASKDDPGSVAFLLKTQNIQIHTIQHEDGTGYNFNLKGFIDIAFTTGEYYTPCKFEAHYNAKTRKGTITVEKGLL